MFLFFFFNDTATTEIYTLSLHDALPILKGNLLSGALTEMKVVERVEDGSGRIDLPARLTGKLVRRAGDRKSTRLNSSHANISYAVFCLKKKNVRYGGGDIGRSWHQAAAH